MALTLFGVGHLGGDPVMRYTPSGTAVTNASVAFNNQWTDSDGQKHKETLWMRFTFWGKSGETVNQYFKKGMPIFIKSAKLNHNEQGYPRIYDRDDGTPGCSFEATVREWEFCGPGNGTPASTSETVPASTTDDDEIPF